MCLQGFFSLQGRARFTALKKLFPGWHLEVANSPADAWKYCLKQVHPWCACCPPQDELGIKPSGQGQRMDLELLKADIVSGKGRKDLVDEHFATVLKYSSGFKFAASVLAPSRNPDTKKNVYFLTGPPGSGKTWFARELIKSFGGDYYSPESNNQGLFSFESYSGQKVIFLDEFSSSNLRCDALKLLTDPFGANKLPGRGCSVNDLSDIVIVTSNLSWKEWYPQDQSAVPALARRAFLALNCVVGSHWDVEVSDGKESPLLCMKNPCPYSNGGHVYPELINFEK